MFKKIARPERSDDIPQGFSKTRVVFGDYTRTETREYYWRVGDLVALYHVRKYSDGLSGDDRQGFYYADFSKSRDSKNPDDKWVRSKEEFKRILKERNSTSDR